METVARGWSVTVLSNDQGQHAWESEQPGSLAITTWLLLPLLSLPCQYLIDLWICLEVLLSEKDTLYLLVANPQRNKMPISCTNFPAWLFLPFNSQLAKSSAPKERSRQKRLLMASCCQTERLAHEEKKPESMVKVRNRKVHSKERKWLCGLSATNLRQLPDPKVNMFSFYHWPGMRITHEKPGFSSAASWQLH